MTPEFIPKLITIIDFPDKIVSKVNVLIHLTNYSIRNPGGVVKHGIDLALNCMFENNLFFLHADMVIRVLNHPTLLKDDPDLINEILRNVFITLSTNPKSKSHISKGKFNNIYSSIKKLLLKTNSYEMTEDYQAIVRHLA